MGGRGVRSSIGTRFVMRNRSGLRASRHRRFCKSTRPGWPSRMRSRRCFPNMRHLIARWHGSWKNRRRVPVVFLEIRCAIFNILPAVLAGLMQGPGRGAPGCVFTSRKKCWIARISRATASNSRAMDYGYRRFNLLPHASMKLVGPGKVVRFSRRCRERVHFERYVRRTFCPPSSVDKMSTLLSGTHQFNKPRNFLRASMSR